MRNLRSLFCLVLCLCLGPICPAGEVVIEQSDLLAPMPPVSGNLYLAANDEEQPSFLDMSGSRRESRGGISMKKAMLLSMLLPGAGEYYAGAKFKGQVFMGVEAAIWGSFLAYRVYGGWKKDDYRRHAQAYAGVNTSGKDDVFYDMVGFYESRDDYNQFGRLYYPDRPYYPDNTAFYWQWQSDEYREEYKELKDESKTAFRNSTFLIGLALVNRVIATIDTWRTVRSAKKKLNSLTDIGDYHLKVSPKPFGHNPSLTLTLSRKF